MTLKNKPYKLIHLNATPEFKADQEKMELINKMCELAGKIKNQKKGKKKL
jgi:hypothetical protein